MGFLARIFKNRFHVQAQDCLDNVKHLAHEQAAYVLAFNAMWLAELLGSDPQFGQMLDNPLQFQRRDLEAFWDNFTKMEAKTVHGLRTLSMPDEVRRHMLLSVYASQISQATVGAGICPELVPLLRSIWEKLRESHDQLPEAIERMRKLMTTIDEDEGHDSLYCRWSTDEWAAKAKWEPAFCNPRKFS